MSDCPCGSGNDFDQCCEPLLEDRRRPQTAEELLRSRYTAFTVHDIRYVRHMVSLIREDPQTNNLLLRYEGYSPSADGKTMVDEEFDMVVLSVGLRPPSSNKKLAESLGIDLNEYGFCWTAPLLPLSTSRPGIFACGAFSAPKDVPETVMQASGAAGMAGRLLASARGTLGCATFSWMHSSRPRPIWPHRRSLVRVV